MTSLRIDLPTLSESEISRMVLYPMIIPGMTSPIVDGDGGIGLGVIGEEASVYCLIDPWYGMQAGDTVDVWLDADNVWHHVVTDQELNERLFFEIPKDWFEPKKRFLPRWIEQCVDSAQRYIAQHLPFAGLKKRLLPKQRVASRWIEECYYTLLRTGEVTSEKSVSQRLLVKLDRPAGRDKEPHLPGHSELKRVQLPPEVIEQGVDAEWAANGIPMTILPYPNIAVRDTIQVKWGSAYLKPLVLTQAHVDGTLPIEVVAEQAEILAGGDSAALLVQYEVYDEVWNFSEDWSITTTVKVDAGAWRLEAPIIEDAVNGIIDLKALNQQDVTVQIRVEGGDFDVGDTITMTWIGTTQTGNPLIHTQTREIANIPSILELRVPYAEVRNIAMGSADASYVLTKKNGDPPLSSKRAFADVIGDVFAHPAPFIHEVVGDILEPDTTMATVDVSYPGMVDGDFIELIWQGTRSNSTPYVHQEVYTVSRNDAERKLITIYVLAEHISELANGRLDLWYRVSNDAAAIYEVSESEHLLVKVQAIAATLPAPKVPEAENDALDPSKVFEKVTVLVDYLGTVKEDVLTCYWTSPNPFASTSDWLPITTVSAGRPVSFRVDANYVTANIGDYVKVRYTLKHAATGLYSYSGTLNLLIGYLVGELPPPQVIQAVGETLDPIEALEGVDINVSYESMDPVLDTVVLKWLGTPGPGTSEDQEKPADQSGTVTFHLAPSFVGPNINRMVSVGYGVKRYGHVNPSQTLSLRVLTFQDPENQLPRPEVPQAVDRVLDLMEFTGDPDVLVKKWPFIALGQRVWLRLEGRALAGTAHSIVLIDGALITDGQVSDGLKQILSRTELLKLAHSSPATVLCKVAFDGAEEESAAEAFPSLPLTIRTRYDYLTPVITQVLDINGDVVDGGKTGEKALTITGTATRGETVELFDSQTVSMGTAPVGDYGIWSRRIENLTLRTYIITAKALYDADPVSSQSRTFSVVVYAETPVIRSITDSRGLVQPGATTYDKSVVIEGDAAADEQVELWDDQTLIITLDVDNNGTWRHRHDNLQVKTYTFKAVAKYVANPVESQPRSLIVAEHIAPRIDSVKGGGVEVPDNGETKSTTVSLQGIVTPDHQVQIYDNNAPKQIVTAVGTTWNTTLAVAVGSHSIMAKALSTGQDSNIRRVRVLSSLAINTAHVSLSGWIFRRHDLTPSNPPAGSFVNRTASGGVPPYRYTSSNPGVAEVNISTGKVISKGNGSAVITVTDGASQSASYPVSVSNVHLTFGTGQRNSYAICSQTAASMGGRIPSLAEWRSYINTYAGIATINEWCWASDSAGFIKRWTIFPGNGQTQPVIEFGWGSVPAVGWGIR